MIALNWPDWVSAWCDDQLGSEPVGTLFHSLRISTVFGLQLADGRRVVLKARPNESRIASCVAAQAQLAGTGFPCARPLTRPVAAGLLVVHAEELRSGGRMLLGESPEVAVLYAGVFARLMAALADVNVAPPLPNPRWVRWDHADPGIWPAIGFLDERDQGPVPAYVGETARQVRHQLLKADLPCVLGHADFEAQNLRWHGREILAVHDWDSLAWQPEAALAGAASGGFSTSGQPMLVPVESSEAFLAAYQESRGRLFTAIEQSIAWAASLWPAAHNARWEALHGQRPLSSNALKAQVTERLRRVHLAN